MDLRVYFADGSHPSLGAAVPLASRRGRWGYSASHSNLNISKDGFVRFDLHGLWENERGHLSLLEINLEGNELYGEVGTRVWEAGVEFYHNNHPDIFWFEFDTAVVSEYTHGKLISVVTERSGAYGFFKRLQNVMMTAYVDYIRDRQYMQMRKNVVREMELHYSHWTPDEIGRTAVA